ncbi:MAG: rod shape-determining protein RodA [Phycisphaerae bacterium]|nr:rod shape-determining protein RodA [Phycisphaerae bacterium]
MLDRQVLNLTRLGWSLAVPVVFLAAVGLSCIHATERDPTPGAAAAAARYAGEERGWLLRTYDALGPMTVRQLVYLLTGTGLLLLVLVPSYQKIGRYAYPVYGITILLLLLLFVDRYVDLPLIPVRNNARRWIQYGFFTLQPSEFMKLALVLVLARYLRFRNSYRRWWGLAPPFLLSVVPMVLILKQPDLGTMLMLLPVLFAMLFVAGARMRHLLVIIVLGTLTLPAFYYFGMKPYQRERIEVLFRQHTTDEAWHMDAGYQLRQSKIALGTGGLTGTGYGAGIFVQYKDLLPEEQNDFIFAIIGHQWGLVGGLLAIGAYVLIIVFGLEVATVTNDPFGRLLAVGVVVMIAVQALLNICMTIGLAPITGMTLPFVSAGGSSLWANFLALGLLVNVAQRRPLLIARPPFEHGDD